MTASSSPKPTMGLGRFKKSFNGRLLYAVSLIAFAQVNFGNSSHNFKFQAVY